MRRTLLTLLAFAFCALGVGCATDDLMSPPAPHGPAAVLDTADTPVEPAGHGGPLTLEPTR